MEEDAEREKAPKTVQRGNPISARIWRGVSPLEQRRGPDRQQRDHANKIRPHRVNSHSSLGKPLPAS